mmetsp:Transcript_2792/g.4018  ORF Transcript_2792/g.4018 Transcript_2792/m.4018 type:complete len:485 (-) Transcript_2792:841-2295(-)|eukprot:CAMPEP_0203785570 /NCGR_PEP_ID=MMETSP0100_2-20121128/1107_1 /ASSEMBLY_ACC=CAM_ASM_000210 /TAXON_ID=96639 /ORGANISM=" , Strain NY0313808BC1" /LENGTH=484 /DNA_ID=CAMNT_0050687701 /DNA_START=364 /DNA_END=1818 /DNA_ORIENTATION=+
MSEYEKRRMEQVQANESFLASLGMDSDAAVLKSGNKRKRANVKPRKKSAGTTVASRKSRRQRGEEAESLYVVSSSRGKVQIGSQPPTMRPNDPSAGAKIGTYDMRAGAGSKDREERFEQQVLDLGFEGDDMSKLGSTFFEQLVEQSLRPGTHISKGDLDYAQRLAGLECKSAIKVVPNRVYSLQFHEESTLICLGDRDGNIGMCKIDKLSEDGDNEVFNFQPHTGVVNSIGYRSDSVFTFSYDGTIRSMSLGKPGIFDLVFKTKSEDDGWLQYGRLWGGEKDNAVLGFSSGKVACQSLRSGKQIWAFEAHEKKVQTVDISSDEKYMVTASLDRSVKLWDVRKVGKNKPLCTFEDTHSVNCCFFNSTGEKMVAVGMCNKLHLFDGAGKSGTLDPTHSVRHDNRTGRYLSVFHAQWDPKSPNSFFCGSMMKPRRVECFSVAKDDKLKLVMNLAGDLVTSVQSRFAVHPKLDILACGNASGRLHIFS